MSLVREGRVWKFGDEINTDLIFPGAAFALPTAEQHKLCFSANRPDWLKQIQAGDIVVGGSNFGMGSGRPVGAVFKACRLGALVAESVNGLCMRNCINYSFPALSAHGVTALFDEGDVARIDFITGTIENRTKKTLMRAQPLHELFVGIIQSGGVVPMLINEGFVEETAFVAPRY